MLGELSTGCLQDCFYNFLGCSRSTLTKSLFKGYEVPESIDLVFKTIEIKSSVLFSKEKL
jgi:hypothetical protein